MAAARRRRDRPFMEPAHRHWKAQLQLGDQLLDAAIGAQFGLDPQAS